MKKDTHISIVYRNYKKIVESEFLKDLSYAPFNKVEYVEILNKHAPIVTKRVKRDKQPEWFNTEVQYARQMRDKLKKT